LRWQLRRAVSGGQPISSCMCLAGGCCMPRAAGGCTSHVRGCSEAAGRSQLCVWAPAVPSAAAAAGHAQPHLAGVLNGSSSMAVVCGSVEEAAARWGPRCLQQPPDAVGRQLSVGTPSRGSLPVDIPSVTAADAGVPVEPGHIVTAAAAGSPQQWLPTECVSLHTHACCLTHVSSSLQPL
jgi:hypothetical protein